MSYPPPPGINSLPPRPPPSTNSKPGFKSAFNQSSTTTYSSPSTHHGQPQSSYQSYSAAPSGLSSYPTSYSSQPQQHYGAAPSYSQQSQSYTQPAQSYSQQPQSYGAPPQIRNPFPVPGTAAASVGPVAGPAVSNDYDPEMAAQIAQWQSAYAPRDPNAPAATTNAGANPAADPSRAAEAANLHPDKKLTVKREGGGKKWTDDTLLEWDPSHLRLFVGNLAGEVTDDSLLKAFSRWSSVQKARVIRDKRTTKSKGYGFVSFSDADDFFQAARDMNNKYIQSRPVTVRKANTDIKVSTAKEKYNNKKGNKNRQYREERNQEPHLGPKQGGGVVKPGQKTKNGLKLLG